MKVIEKGVCYLYYWEKDKHYYRHILMSSLPTQQTLKEAESFTRSQEHSFPLACLFRRGRKTWTEIFVRPITQIKASQLMLQCCTTQLQQYTTVTVAVL